MVVGAIRSKIGMQRVPSNARSTPLHFVGIQPINLRRWFPLEEIC